MLLALCGCGNRDSSSKVDGENFGDAALSLVGLSGHEIAVVWLQKQNVFMLGCLEEAGYQLGPGEVLDPQAAAVPKVPVYFSGDTVRGELEAFLAGSVANPQGLRDSPVAYDDPRQARLNFCREQARVGIVNPLATYYDWIDVAARESIADADADPRSADARARASLCLSALGYPARDQNELMGLFQERAGQIVSAGGDRDSIVRGLEKLSAEETSVAPQANECIERSEALIQRVSDEYQREFLDRHADAVIEHLKNFKEAVDKLIESSPS